MEDKTTLRIIIFTSVILLIISIYFNISSSLYSLGNPLYGEGLGRLCNSEEDCMDFCNNNMGQCNNYCDKNKNNGLCEKLIIRWKSLI